MNGELLVQQLEETIERLFQQNLISEDDKDTLFLACAFRIPEIRSILNQSESFPEPKTTLMEPLLFERIPSIKTQMAQQGKHQKGLGQEGKHQKEETSSRESSPQGTYLLEKKRIQDSAKPSLQSFKIRLQQSK